MYGPTCPQSLILWYRSHCKIFATVNVSVKKNHLICWFEGEVNIDEYRLADNVTLQTNFSGKTLGRACVKGPSYWLVTWKPVWYMACERATEQCNLATTIIRTFTSHGNVVQTQQRVDRHFTPSPLLPPPTVPVFHRLHGAEELTPNNTLRLQHPLRRFTWCLPTPYMINPLVSDNNHSRQRAVLSYY